MVKNGNKTGNNLLSSIPCIRIQPVSCRIKYHPICIAGNICGIILIRITPGDQKKEILQNSEFKKRNELNCHFDIRKKGKP